MQLCFWKRTLIIVVKNAKWSDPGGEEAQGSPVQLELRPTAQWASCAHLSGEKCVPCAYMEVGHLKSKCYIKTSTTERQHGDWKHERQRIGHMYGGTWVRTAPFLPSVCVIFYDFLDVIE